MNSSFSDAIKYFSGKDGSAPNPRKKTGPYIYENWYYTSQPNDVLIHQVSVCLQP